MLEGYAGITIRFTDRSMVTVAAANSIVAAVPPPNGPNLPR